METASPASTMMSVTPRAGRGTRLGSSVTPTALAFHRSLTFETPESPLAAIPIDDSSEPEDADWEDDAVISWSGEGGRDRSIAHDAQSVQDTEDASSVNAEEAGLINSDDDGDEMDDDEEDEDEWGRDAMLEWDHEPGMATVSVGFASDTEVSEADDEGEEEQEEILIMTDEDDEDELDEEPSGSRRRRSHGSQSESKADLLARGMPDYDSWEVKKLQKLCASYGYRPSTKHNVLVDIASACWLALNPARADKPTLPTKRANRAPPMPAPSGSNSSITSAEVPLANVKSRKKGSTQDANKAKTKKKSRIGEEADRSQPEPLDLKKAFHDMIIADVELYLRILRYEVRPAQMQAGTRPSWTELMHNCSRFRSTNWWPSAWPMGSVRRVGKTRSRSGLTSRSVRPRSDQKTRS